jgi:hypothetical protein
VQPVGATLAPTAWLQCGVANAERSRQRREGSHTLRRGVAMFAARPDYFFKRMADLFGLTLTKNPSNDCRLRSRFNPQYQSQRQAETPSAVRGAVGGEFRRLNVIANAVKQSPDRKRDCFAANSAARNDGAGIAAAGGDAVGGSGRLLEGSFQPHPLTCEWPTLVVSIHSLPDH